MAYVLCGIYRSTEIADAAEHDAPGAGTLGHSGAGMDRWGAPVDTEQRWTCHGRLVLNTRTRSWSRILGQHCLLIHLVDTGDGPNPPPHAGACTAEFVVSRSSRYVAGGRASSLGRQRALYRWLEPVSRSESHPIWLYHHWPRSGMGCASLSTARSCAGSP